MRMTASRWPRAVLRRLRTLVRWVSCMPGPTHRGWGLFPWMGAAGSQVERGVHVAGQVRPWSPGGSTWTAPAAARARRSRRSPVCSRVARRRRCHGGGPVGGVERLRAAVTGSSGMRPGAPVTRSSSASQARSAGFGEREVDGEHEGDVVVVVVVVLERGEGGGQSGERALSGVLAVADLRPGQRAEPSGGAGGDDDARRPGLGEVAGRSVEEGLAVDAQGRLVRPHAPAGAAGEDDARDVRFLLCGRCGAGVRRTVGHPRSSRTSRFGDRRGTERADADRSQRGVPGV